MKALLTCVALLAGCKQVFGIGDPVLVDDGGFGDDDSGDDSPGDDGGIDDCFSDWIDGTVRLGSPMTVVSDADYVRSPHIAVNEDVIWYQGYSGAELETVRYATRTSLTDAFSPGSVEPDLTSDTGELDVSLTEDELTVVVTSFRDAASFDIYYGQRATPTQPFGALTRTQVASLNTSNLDEVDASLSGDGLELFSTRNDAGLTTIVTATRSSRTASFGAATAVGLGGNDSDAAPTLASNNRVLVFDSLRDGPLRLYYAVRPARGQPFAAPQFVPIASASPDSRDGMLSFDGCTLYYVRPIRDGGGDVTGEEIVSAPVLR